MNEKYGFVYVWYDRKHKRYYIGSHWGHEDDGYVCSSSWMKSAYKRRPEDFRRRIVARVTSSRQDLLLEENRWLQMIDDEELGKRFYNLYNTVRGHWMITTEGRLNVGQKISKRKKGKPGKPHTEETKQKLRESNKNFKHTEESKLKMRGRKISEETRVKISQSKVGTLRESPSEETRKRISEATRGKHKRSEETKQKISNARTGIIFSEEHKDKLRLSRINKTLSEETRQKISASLRARRK